MKMEPIRMDNTRIIFDFIFFAGYEKNTNSLDTETNTVISNTNMIGQEYGNIFFLEQENQLNFY